ncbi:MAG: hypothetical protein IJU03_01945 [Thermoguttaceae bacterium]|nr:hypothetical protein [Thermoguttaceae bacterium]
MTKSKTKNAPFRSRVLRVESLEARTLLSADGLRDYDAANADFAADSEYVSHAEIENVAEGQVAWYLPTSSGVTPTAEEQELLEQINRFRADPQGELARIFRVYNDDELVAYNNLVNDAILLNAYPRDSISTFLSEWRSLSATSPLAFNAALNSAAASHASFMRTKNEISHKCSGEDDLATRIAKSGFVSGATMDGGYYSVSENVGGGFSAYENFSVASYILASFAVDWGVPAHSHRDALMNPDYSEIGVSILQTNKSVGPSLTTCDFGTSQDGARSDGAYLLGVVYNDLDEDLFYDVGEGVGDVELLIERLDGDGGESVSIKSWDSGGYQLFLVNGLYRVTVSGEQFQTTISKTISIVDGVNEKLDFRVGEAGMNAPIVDLNGSAEGYDYSTVFVEGAEDALDALTSSNLKITDEDSAYLYGAKICFGERPDGADETLDVSISGSELRASFEDRSGIVTITGTGAIEDYVDAILSLSYFNAKEYCDVASEHTVLISVFDGTSWSNEAKLSISIKPTKLPSMTVSEMVAYEGDTGSVRKTFAVELDSPARLDVSFNFNVSIDGTAVEGADFIVAKGDPIVIPAGQTSAEIECYVLGNYDSLKPEGIQKLDDGGFEKPFVYFQLELTDVENAFLTNENSLVKGTIYDDDSPVAVGVVDEYKLKELLSTESGERRYLFTIKPEEEGFFTWNTDSLALPEGAKISVRAGELDSEPIATSSVTAKGGRVQWLADPDVQYWVMIESAEDLTLVSARLMAITEEKVVLVDPILEGADEELVHLMWQGEGLDLQVGDWLWNFGEEYASAGMTVKTTLPDIEFVTTLPPYSYSELSVEDEGFETKIDGSRGITTVGFATINYNGADENEELVLLGTPGYDYLYYANGVGYFQTSEGNMFNFSRVNKVRIDGGGGEDYAYVEDSVYNDLLETNAASLMISGGGFELAATNFSRSFVLFNHGGEDEYYAFDSGDDVAVTISNGSSILQGKYAVAQTIAGENEEQIDGDANGELTEAKYTRVVMGVEKTAIAPQETIGEVVLSGEFSTSSYFNATVGALTAYDRGGQRETSIQRAQTLTISGLHPYAESRFSVELPESYSVKRESDYLSITDLETNWVLRAPLWKNIEANPEASAAVIDVFENTRLIFEDNTFQSPFADERFLTTTLQNEEVEDDVIGTLALSRVSATGRAQRKASNLGEEFDENEMLQIVLTPIFLPYR